ncbi:MAG: PKD domain-containing protein [Pseudomonadota bacterium]
MKASLRSSTSWKIAILAVMAITACKQARYEVLKPGLIKPNNFTDANSAAPTARVEVIVRGVSVTWIYAGGRADIRPSTDSLDPDYIGKDKCENPGLIGADYDLGNSTKPTVTRDANCSNLATTGQVFNTPGDYLIKMTVKSKDNEQATASMTLRVVAKSIPADQVEGGFTIHAKPILVALNQPVTFTGICELKGHLTIDWDYADTAIGAGVVTLHTYTKLGQYLVNATCANDAGKKMLSSLTIVVMNNPPTSPNTNPLVPGNNPNLPASPLCDPTQGPCQSAGQIPDGSQQVPTDNGTIWFYDPKCHCYIGQ